MNLQRVTRFSRASISFGPITRNASSIRKIFVTGTDTDIGKTIVSSWLCLHLGWDYFKPISSGPHLDSVTLQSLTGVKTHPEIYSLSQPLSPHLASTIDKVQINLDSIALPQSQNLVVEGCGGLLVPLNAKDLVIDLIKRLQLPVILVASSRLGTINHTLMSLEVLKSRSVPILGVIVKGVPNQENCDAIEHYGNVQVLAQVPHFEVVTRESLLDAPLPHTLKELLL